jgi:general secretion pathway protein D
MHRALAMVAGLLAAACLLAGCKSWLEPERIKQRRAAQEQAIAKLPPAGTVGLEPGQVTPLFPEDVTEPETTIAPVIERGTGRVAGQPTPRTQASIGSATGGRVTLNVVDADLREVVRLVLEDTLGANYVIDPAVEGAITLQTSQPIPVEDLTAVLDATLRLNGAALVRTGDLYKVVPLDQALTAGLIPEVRPIPDAGQPGFSVQAVPVRYVGVTELAEILAPFAPPGGLVRADPARNLLLLAGSADQLSALVDLVSIFDVDRMAGMSFGLFPLEAAAAEPLAGELEQLFGQQEEAAGGVISFVPIERLNAVLVMTTQPDYLDRARTWINRLDRGAEGDEPKVYVYAVQNGRAADLAEVLSQLFGLPSAAVGGGDLLAPGLEPATIGSLTGDREGLGEVGDTETGGFLGERLGGPSGTRSQLGGAASGAAERIRPEEGETRIIADNTTNSLVIRARPRDYRRIESALEQLDIRPLQVLIEATIAEVTLNDELRYGLQWFIRSGDFAVSSSTNSPAPRGIGPPRGDLSGGIGDFLGVLNPLAGGGFNALFANDNEVRVLLSALETATDLNVISSPQVVVLDNQTAQLQVGNEVPILTQQQQSTTAGDASIINNIEQRQTGVILNVTPRVNTSGLVLLEIEQEVSDVVSTSTGEINSPTISNRRVASTVAVQSGQTVALGGLIQDRITEGSRGTPVLSRLPFVGFLFGEQNTEARRSELLVLLTPRVIRDPLEARRVTEELRQRLESVRTLESRIR